MAIPLMPSGTGGSGRLCWYRDEAVRTAAVYEDIRGGDCGAPPPPRPEADAAQVQEVQRRKEALAAVAEASRKVRLEHTSRHGPANPAALARAHRREEVSYSTPEVSSVPRHEPLPCLADAGRAQAQGCPR